MVALLIEDAVRQQVRAYRHPRSLPRWASHSLEIDRPTPMHWLKTRLEVVRARSAPRIAPTGVRFTRTVPQLEGPTVHRKAHSLPAHRLQAASRFRLRVRATRLVPKSHGRPAFASNKSISSARRHPSSRTLWPRRRCLGALNGATVNGVGGRYRPRAPPLARLLTVETV